MQPQHILAAGVALLIAIVSGVWFGGRPSDPAPAIFERNQLFEPAVEVQRITVHVSGAVANPGLVEVARDARVADALSAAGGALPSADLSSMNLAAPVADGTLIVVAERGVAGRPIAQPSDGLVHVNIASAEEIATLPGIGPVLAERIFEFRQANGPFGSVEDLLDVSGIGEATLATLREAVSIP